MVILTVNIDKELYTSVNNILLKSKGTFRNRSHLVSQLLVRGLDDYLESETWKKLLGG